MKKFYFTDDSWFDNGYGCDCCPGEWVWVYNSSDTHPSLGSAHSVEECYVDAVASVLIGRSGHRSVDMEALEKLCESELKALCKDMKIEVEIEL